MEKTYIFEYLDENDFRKKERSVRKYNMLAYKKLTFTYYPELRKGTFLGKEVNKNEKNNTVSYELQLPTDELFKKVHGPIILHYTVYTEKNIILLTNITPEGILDEGHRAELSTYKGVMIYQAVVTRNNPFSYEITVTYEGVVSKKDPIYLYTIEYEKIEDEPQVIIEEKNDYTVPTIIISGLGIALVIVYIIGRNTARVYVKTDNGFKLIRVVRLSKKHNTVNLSNYKHKTVTNMFAIKTTTGFYNKNKNMLIKVKKDKITKNVYLNSAYIAFILG